MGCSSYRYNNFPYLGCSKIKTQVRNFPIFASIHDRFGISELNRSGDYSEIIILAARRPISTAKLVPRSQG